MAVQLRVAGAGSGGVSEISATLAADDVTFGLARVPVGHGAFRREKYVLLHYSLGAFRPRPARTDDASR
jgi:hypothetical protein